MAPTSDFFKPSLIAIAAIWTTSSAWAPMTCTPKIRSVTSSLDDFDHAIGFIAHAGGGIVIVRQFEGPCVQPALERVGFRQPDLTDVIHVTSALQNLEIKFTASR